MRNRAHPCGTGQYVKADPAVGLQATAGALRGADLDRAVVSDALTLTSP